MILDRDSLADFICPTPLNPETEPKPGIIGMIKAKVAAAIRTKPATIEPQPKYMQTTEERDLLSTYKANRDKMGKIFGSLSRISGPIGDDSFESLYLQTISINEQRIKVAEEIIIMAMTMRSEAETRGFRTLVDKIDEDIDTFERDKIESKRAIAEAQEKRKRKTGNADIFDPDIDTF